MVGEHWFNSGKTDERERVLKIVESGIKELEVLANVKGNINDYSDKVRGMIRGYKESLKILLRIKRKISRK